MSRTGTALPRARYLSICLPLLLLLSPLWIFAQSSSQATITASSTGSVLSTPGLQSSGFASSQVIVRFQPGAAAQALPGGRSVRSLSQALNLHLMDVPPGITVSQAVAQYRNNPNVIYAEPDYIVYADTTPNDTKWAQQWDMTQIAAPAAWDTQTNAGNIVVAIIDTGVTFNHEDLAANIWTHTDGSHGFNCIGGTCVPGGIDDHGHGTHVAGTIGAVGNNGKGIAGINWNVKMAAFKFLNSSGSGNISDAIAAFGKIKQLIQQNVPIRVTNNSWGGGGYSQALKDAMLEVEALGAVNVCAAGNSGLNADVAPMYPGAYNNPGIISVIATDSADIGAGFTNYGLASTDIAAPGVNTLSTVPTGTCSLCDATGYKLLSGTSMAAPHVAGVVAAMMQINPALTAPQARDIVLDPASYDWMTTTRAQSTSSGGRLNFNKVIHNPKLLSPGTLNGFPSLTMGSDVSTGAGGAVSISATSSDPDGDTLRTVTSKTSTSAWLFGWMQDSLFPTPSANPSNFSAPSLARTATVPYLGATADNRGGGASAVQFVTVSPLSNPGSPPIGTLTASASTAPVGGTITFSFPVTDPDGSGTPAWDLWAAGPLGASGSCCFTGTSASMQFTGAGAFRVAAQAVDRRLDLSNRSTTIVRIGGATGVPPLAAAVLDKLSGPVPLTVSVNMAGSTDPDGTIANYYIGCGGYFAAPSTNPIGSCQFTTPGTYWLVLQVMDNSGLMDVVSAYVVATPSTGGGGGGGGGGEEDETPPTVAMTTPSEGATVSGTVDVAADASDASGISKVDFYRDSGVFLGTATQPSSGVNYKISWNTTGLAPGTHTLYAVATDTANNTATSALRSVMIPQPPPPPPPPKGPQSVSITSPKTGSTVPRKATVTISATAQPGDRPIARVEIFVNSGMVCSDGTAPYSCNWKVPAAPGKTYSIYAIAYDTAGLSAISPTEVVTAP